MLFIDAAWWSEMIKIRILESHLVAEFYVKIEKKI